MYESRWLSVKGFFAGAELLRSDARLSLTGLFLKQKMKERCQISLNADN